MEEWSVTFRTTSSLALLIVAFALLPTVAYGGTIGPFEGSYYTLTYNSTPVATGSGTETYRVTYVADTSGYSGTGSYLDSVALKVTSSSTLIGATPISAPGGIDNWLLRVNDTLNAEGCTDGSNGGFVCDDLILTSTQAVAYTGVPNTQPYTWVFDVTVASGSLFTGTDQASIKARYANMDGTKAGALLSQNITLTSTPPSQVPEPSSIILLASGLLGVPIAAWRRRKKS